MRKFVPVIFPFLLLTILTVAGYFITLSNYQGSIQSQFEEESYSRIAAIQRSIEDKILILESMLALYEVYRGIPEPEFGSLVQPFEDNIPGVQALQWVVPIKAENRATFEADMIAQGITGFQITEQVGSNMLRAADRSVYYPVYPVLPLDEGEISIGFDLASDQVRNAAIQSAIETQSITASARVSLLQSGDPNQFGFLFFIPLFDTSGINPGNNSQDNLLGLVVGVFSFSSLVESAIANINTAPIQLLLEDNSAASPETVLLYQSLVQGNAGSQTTGFLPEAVTRTFDIGGRQWSVTATPVPAYMDGHSPTIAWLVLVTGMFASIMLALYLWLQMRQELRFRQTELAREELENKLVRSQKMEAIGLLVGGIAHDFNNILTSVQGYCELAQMKNDEDGDKEMADYLKHIISGSKRGELLINKMLTFSRDVPRRDNWIDIRESISNTLGLLKPLISGEISVIVDLAEDVELPKVRLDKISFDQLLINLCVNARDAIIGSGEIIISPGRKNMNSKQQCSACGDEIRGDFVTVSVRDSGEGIKPQSLNSIFVPFYTTKDAGKGSGMGLAIINSIIHNNDGHIMVTSSEVKGTEFVLYLPAREQSAS